jgi:NAD-reducing hydrogenase small subunit
MVTMHKLRFATAWLGGCSGCHMSFLDLDEKLIDLADKIELVYSPIADVKEFPEGVDVTLVEGAVANLDNLKLAQEIRARSRLVVSFGDCAVTGNVPSLRNKLGVDDLLTAVYHEGPGRHPTGGDADHAQTAAQSAAAASGRQGGCLPARLPARRRPHLGRGQRAAGRRAGIVLEPDMRTFG